MLFKLNKVALLVGTILVFSFPSISFSAPIEKSENLQVSTQYSCKNTKNSSGWTEQVVEPRTGLTALGYGYRLFLLPLKGQVYVDFAFNKCGIRMKFKDFTSVEFPKWHLLDEKSSPFKRAAYDRLETLNQKCFAEMGSDVSELTDLLEKGVLLEEERSLCGWLLDSRVLELEIVTGKGRYFALIIDGYTYIWEEKQ